jgi:hypothetical protein
MTKTSINFVTVIRFIYRNFAHGGFIFFNKAGWSLHSKHPQDCQPDLNDPSLSIQRYG